MKKLPRAAGDFTVDSLLFVGVEPLGQFRYRQIREFARRTLEALASSLPQTRHLCLTLHGPNFGLDEIEAFEAEVAGLIEAITSDAVPEQLKRITIVDRDPIRVTNLKETLPALLPHGYVEDDLRKYVSNLDESETQRFRSVGYASESKPRIFVAMPFVNEMEDTYHFGIRQPVQEAGFLCETADLSVFKGGVMEWLEGRVKGADFVIADLSKADPNVYLIAGYAWGQGKPVVLLARKTEDVKFDVRGRKIITYGQITELAENLSEELEALSREVSSDSNM